MALKDTISLPQTGFPMRAGLAQREPEYFAACEANDLYHRILAQHAADPSFILHDGPPYANGDIHMGHALNKILKDLVVRSRSMAGHRAPYVPGWDCHGLPIEQQILKTVGDRLHEMEPLELRHLCQQYAAGWIDKQREQFKRLGILGDWADPYITYTPRYEAGILKVLHALAERGLVRRGHKAVHWDPVFRTALAEAEIEYHPHRSPSIYVAMPLVDASLYPSLVNAGIQQAAIVIWTTTPWTMPANLGISLHPELPYCAVRTATGHHYIVAEGLVEPFVAACNLTDCSIVARFASTEFDRGLARHPIFDDKTSLIMLGSHVTLEQGTGCVHTAPGHGTDDFMIGQAYGLPVFCPVDARGRYTDAVPQFAGQEVFAANPQVVALLRDRGLLLAHREIQHDYPFSWRSKKPIIYRATEQWFVQLADGGVRDQALAAIDHAVEWIPRWGYDRIRGMVERRPEWCISRQRHWGVPIPAVRSRRSGQSILDPRIIARFIEIVEREGTDAWYARPLADFIPPGFIFEPTGESSADDFTKEFDILDVWFDSGASHVAVLEQDPRLSWPADLYLEGSDQHRGWFQSSLLTAIGARGAAPYRAVLTHGFVLDGAGKAMSKSEGNVISPLDLIGEFGTDILRLWVASTDYRTDVGISAEVMRTSADAYRTIRNSLRFQLGNLADFDPAHHQIAPHQLNPLDQWALHELAELVDAVNAAYDRYEFHRVFHLVNRFFTVTLSAQYHDILKDRLYTFRKDSPERRSSQTVIYLMADALCRMLAPILVFTADEAWQHLPGLRPANDSVHLHNRPTVAANWRAPAVHEAVSALLGLRAQVNEQLEDLRGHKAIGKSIEARIDFLIPDGHPLAARLTEFHALLPELYIVSAVGLAPAAADAALAVTASAATGVRCPRCWRTVDALVTVPGYDPVCPRCADAIQ
jgi:isoleucyl-tRNA synthetase